MAMLLFVGLTLSVLVSRNQLREVIYDDRKSERESAFNTVINLESQTLKDITRENTYWDEMVDFIKQPASPKSKAFKDDVLGAQVSLYGVQSIWTYNKDFLLTSNVAVPESPSFEKSYAIISSDIPKIFSQNREVHFYMTTDSGPMEVFGATVHSSNDKDRQTQPEGYFFIGRLINTSYLDKVSRLTHSDVVFVPDGRQHDNGDDIPGRITFTKRVTSYDGSTVGFFHTNYISQNVMHIVSSFDKIIANIFVTYIFLAAVVYFIIGRLIIRPLYMVHKALANNDRKPLVNLLTRRSEFGRIANLITDHFDERDKINVAIKENISSQQKLQERTVELEHTNSLMINRELKMIELKKEIKELKQKLQQVKTSKGTKHAR